MEQEERPASDHKALLSGLEQSIDPDKQEKKKRDEIHEHDLPVRLKKQRRARQTKRKREADPPGELVGF